MRASSPRNRGNRSWRRVDLDTDRLAAVLLLLREAGKVMGEGTPILAHAFYDAVGRARRVHATFADGWRATLVIYVDGTCSLSQALKIRCERTVAL